MVKNPPANAGDKRDVGLIPGLGRSLEKGMATLQDSCLENSVDRGAWRATVHGVAQGQTRLKRLSTALCNYIHTLLLVSLAKVLNSWPLYRLIYNTLHFGLLLLNLLFPHPLSHPPSRPLYTYIYIYVCMYSG